MVLVQRKSLLEDSRGSTTVVVRKEVVEFVDRSRFTKVFKSLSFFCPRRGFSIRKFYLWFSTLWPIYVLHYMYCFGIHLYGTYIICWVYIYWNINIGQWYFHTHSWYFRTNLETCAMKRPNTPCVLIFLSSLCLSLWGVFGLLPAQISKLVWKYQLWVWKYHCPIFIFHYYPVMRHTIKFCPPPIKEAHPITQNRGPQSR